MAGTPHPAGTAPTKKSGVFVIFPSQKRALFCILLRFRSHFSVVLWIQTWTILVIKNGRWMVWAFYLSKIGFNDKEHKVRVHKYKSPTLLLGFFKILE